MFFSRPQGGAALAPYKRFAHGDGLPGAKPWRRGDSLAPSRMKPGSPPGRAGWGTRSRHGRYPVLCDESGEGGRRGRHQCGEKAVLGGFAPKPRRAKDAGSRTGGRGTFSYTRESTQRACPGGAPPGYPPLSLDASFSFRRPKQDGLPVPSAAYGLVRVCFRRYSAPSRAPTRVKKLGLGVRSTNLLSESCPTRRPTGCARPPQPCQQQGGAR